MESLNIILRTIFVFQVPVPDLALREPLEASSLLGVPRRDASNRVSGEETPFRHAATTKKATHTPCKPKNGYGTQRRSPAWPHAYNRNMLLNKCVSGHRLINCYHCTTPLIKGLMGGKRLEIQLCQLRKDVYPHGTTIPRLVGFPYQNAFHKQVSSTHIRTSSPYAPIEGITIRRRARVGLRIRECFPTSFRIRSAFCERILLFTGHIRGVVFPWR